MSFFLSKIEIVGWVAIPVGITLFFIRPRYLYYLTIFFIPFSATAVFNFQTKQVSIIIGTYWASLWILHEVILIIIKKKETRLPRITIFLFSFLSLCLAVSLFMPFFLEGKVQLYVFEKSVSEPLEFRPWHLMSFFYVVFGALVTIFVVIKNKDTRQLLASLRTYALSGFIVSLIGILEVLFYKLSISNPLYFLNNAASSRIIEKGRVLSDSVTGIRALRISSVAEEPSFLAQHLLNILPILIFAVICKYKIISKKMDRLAIVLVFIILFFSTSATGYFGLTGMLILIIMIFFRLKLISYRFIFLIVAITLVAALVYMTNSSIREFSNIYVLDKLNTGSGLDRIESIKMGLGYFNKSPIFGIGLGIFPVYDLIINLLSGSGIAGLISFLSLISFALFPIFRIIKMGRGVYEIHTLKYIAASILISNTVCLMTAEMAGFRYRLLDFWFLLGLAFSFPNIYNKKDGIFIYLPKQKKWGLKKV